MPYRVKFLLASNVYLQWGGAGGSKWLLFDSAFFLPSFSLVYPAYLYSALHKPKAAFLLTNGIHSIMRGIPHQVVGSFFVAFVIFFNFGGNFLLIFYNDYTNIHMTMYKASPPPIYLPVFILCFLNDSHSGRAKYNVNVLLNWVFRVIKCVEHFFLMYVLVICTSF